MSDKNNELNLNERQQAISDLFIKAVKIEADGASANGTLEDGKAFLESVLPEGITAAQLKKMQEFQTDFFVGTAHGAAQASHDFLKKHKKVDSVLFKKIPLGKDSIKHNVERETTVTAVGGTSTVRHSWITSKYTTGAGSTSAAAYGRLRSHFAELGASEFAKA